MRDRWLLVLLLAGTVAAEGPVQQPHAQAELIARSTAIQPGRDLELGLRLALDPGWHVYWKNPGDAGLAPALEWTLPEGFRAGPIRWPAPSRIPTGPLMNFGYEGELLLPVTIHVPADLAGPMVRIGVRATWLVCEKVCLPGEADLELELRVAEEAARPDPRWKALFERTDRLLPRPPPAGAIKARRLPGQLRLDLIGIGARGALAFYPEDEGAIEYAAPQIVQRDADGTRLIIAPGPEEAPRLRGVLTVTSGDTVAAIAVDLPIGEDDSAPPWVGLLAIGALVAAVVFAAVRGRRLE